jgi:hypothetical protein
MTFLDKERGKRRKITKEGGAIMTHPLPEGELLRRAIRWISEQREGGQKKPLIDLITEAGKQFDLSPKEGDFLIHFFTEAKEK